MKLFFGGSAAFAATLLSASVLFYAKPLLAEDSAVRTHTSTQQEKTEQAPVETIARAETPQASEATLTAAPVNVPVTTGDSNGVLTLSITEEPPAAPVAAAPITGPQQYVATAYSLPGRTASGMRVAKGVIAADPRVLPLGTRVRLEAGPYSGEYVVADTGSAVRGRKIDVWVPSYGEACRFGRRNIKLSVLSYGKKRNAKAATRARRRS